MLEKSRHTTYQTPLFEIVVDCGRDVVMVSGDIIDNGDGTFDNIGRFPEGWGGL